MPGEAPLLNLDPKPILLVEENITYISVDNNQTLALLDTGSRVNTVTPSYVQVHRCNVLPLDQLTDKRLTLMGVGGFKPTLIGWVMFRLQIPGFCRHDEDQIALVVPDSRSFAARVPIILGTPAIDRVINVILESELDELATPWVRVRIAMLKAKHSRENLHIRLSKIGITCHQATTTEYEDPFDFNEVRTIAKTVSISPYQIRRIKVNIKTQFRGCPHNPVVHSASPSHPGWTSLRALPWDPASVEFLRGHC